MTPLSFDSTTAREVTGDAELRSIEARARADADAGAFDPPTTEGSTYWSQVRAEMRRVVYADQHRKRTERMKRIGNAAH